MIDHGDILQQETLEIPPAFQRIGSNCRCGTKTNLRDLGVSPAALSSDNIKHKATEYFIAQSYFVEARLRCSNKLLWIQEMTGYRTDAPSCKSFERFQDLTSIRPVSRMNPSLAGVTAVYALPAVRLSTCTTVLPTCSCHERITSPSRTATAPYSTVSEKPMLSPATISTISSRSERKVIRGVNVGNLIHRRREAVTCLLSSPGK